MVRQTWTDLDHVSHVMDFIYDNNGKPYAFYYDGTLYYYITNLQGDVIRIIDTAGATICTYTYDAWGRLLNSSTNQIFKANPIRYRGYYYDTESGLYYLGSRYYDPAVKRFINADAPGFAVASGTMLSKNLFVYCENCPTIADDQNGQWINVVIGAVVGSAISAATTAITGGDAAQIVTSAITGAVSGGFAATGLGGIMGQTAVGAITSGIDSAVGAYADYKKGDVNCAGAVARVVAGTIVGVGFSAMGFEGEKSVNAFKKSCSITKEAWNAIKTKFSRNALRSAKKNAGKAIRIAGKYAAKTALGEFLSGSVSSFVSWGTSWYAGRYYTWSTGGNRYGVS